MASRKKSNKVGLSIAGIALIAFGAFFLLRKDKDLTSGATRQPLPPELSRPKIITPEPVKFFDKPSTKLGLEAGLTPAQIFGLSRTGRINP